jgi:hypothetical protein
MRRPLLSKCVLKLDLRHREIHQLPLSGGVIDARRVRRASSSRKVPDDKFLARIRRFGCIMRISISGYAQTGSPTRMGQRDMDRPHLTKLTLEISAKDATTDEVDQITRQLLSELRELDVESAQLVQDGRAPSGTKAVDPVTVGSIGIAVLPTLLPKVVDAVQAWALRGANRTVKFRGKVGGQAIEFEGSPEELHKVLARLSRSKRKR